MMQTQIPFAALRIVHKALNQRSPEADAFLWDGSYDLPTLHLSVHITTLSCVPSQDLFESVLMDFNTLVSRITISHRHIALLCHYQQRKYRIARKFGGELWFGSMHLNRQIKFCRTFLRVCMYGDTIPYHTTNSVKNELWRIVCLYSQPTNAKS